MRYLLLLIISILPCLSHAQQCVFSYKENMLATFEFELKNYDKIIKDTKGDTIAVVLNFNESGLLDKVSYYDSYKNDDTFGKPVKVWKGLDTFIREMYPFNQSSVFDREYPWIDKQTFRLPVKKEDIIKSINFIKNELLQESKSKKQLMADYETVDINPDAPFVLAITKLELDDMKYPAKKIIGVLRYLDSGTIRLSNDSFMIFKILKTSENGDAHNYFEYKLFKEQKDGTALLYVKEGNVSFYNNVVQLKVKGNREYISDEGETIKSDESFDFEIDIIFK